MTWSTKKIGEVVEENKKSPFKVEDADNLGNFPFFTSGEAVLKHSHFLVDGENLFLSTGGSAYVKFYNGKSAYSTDTWCLKPKIVSSKFLYYTIFYSIKFIGARFFSGSGLKHLQKNEFLNFQIFFPPISVQQKIVLVLDTVRDAVEMQEKIIELTKELKNGLMAKLFREGAPSFSKGRKLKKTEIGEIPEDWGIKKLGDKDVLQLIVDHRGKTPKKLGGDWSLEGIPSLSAKNIKEGEMVNENEIKFVNQSLYDKWMPVKLESGDVLLTSEAPAGEALLLKEKKDYCLSQRLYALRFKKEVIDSSFFYYLVYSPILQDQLISRSTGSIAKGIKQTELLNILVIIPSISEQREIVGILETIDQKIEIEQKKKALYEELFKTMLNKIMKQEIDVEKINL